MEVRRLCLLRDFRVHGTVAATAKALHLTGPAVSQQLAVLEREAGLPLLEKQGRTLRLTPAGHLLAEHAEVIIGQLAAVEADLAGLRGGDRGHLVHIAVFASAARVLLPQVWRALARDHARPPELRIIECERQGAVASLRRKDADIAVVHSYSLLPGEVPTGCEQYFLAEEPVLLALPTRFAARHGLAEGDAADLGRFVEENWLMPGPETTCHELTRRACGAVGFVPRPVAIASDFSVLTALVGAEVGVTLVPKMALPPSTEGISLHPLEQPVRRTVSALTRIGEAGTPYLTLVLDTLRAASAAISAG